MEQGQQKTNLKGLWARKKCSVALATVYKVGKVLIVSNEASVLRSSAQIGQREAVQNMYTRPFQI